jgi:hypothetical protein
MAVPTKQFMSPKPTEIMRTCAGHMQCDNQVLDLDSDSPHIRQTTVLTKHVSQKQIQFVLRIIETGAQRHA